MDHTWAFTHLGLGGEAALAIYVVALVMAGVSDFRTLRIPNWLTGALALAFPIAALAAGQPVNWLSHVGAGLAVFAVAAVLFAFRLMGGGDVKLLGATALWVGFGQLLPFLMLVAFVGGIFALVCVLLRHPFVQTAILATLRRLPVFAYKNLPIPYGIPIAVAGVLIAPALPIFS
ncbi:MAG TPA: prepilin peptidase [Stellaceae bacterium]|nr:prepilin peptidase [Stellaceae bacterium]